MITVYIVYFNNESEVIPLRLCENYTDAEKNFEGIMNDFIKIYYADADRSATTNITPPTGTPSTGTPLTIASDSVSAGVVPTSAPIHPFKICKYEENVNSSATLFSATLYKDISFPFGIAAVRKRHEACLYEKTRSLGSLWYTYAVKYLGRIGVMSVELPEQTRIINTMKEVTDKQEERLQDQTRAMQLFDSQNKTEIQRLELLLSKQKAEVERLEYTNNILEQHLAEVKASIPPPPPFSSPSSTPSSCLEWNESPLFLIERKAPVKKKPTEMSAKKDSYAPVLEELTKLLAEKKKIIDTNYSLDVLIAEIDNFGVTGSFSI